MEAGDSHPIRKNYRRPRDVRPISSEDIRLAFHEEKEEWTSPAAARPERGQTTPATGTNRRASGIGTVLGAVLQAWAPPCSSKPRAQPAITKSKIRSTTAWPAVRRGNSPRASQIARPHTQRAQTTRENQR